MMMMITINMIHPIILIHPIIVRKTIFENEKMKKNMTKHDSIEAKQKT